MTETIDFFGHLTLLPFVCGCALNPWLYAYHNLDLKPLMLRIIQQKLTLLGLNVRRQTVS